MSKVDPQYSPLLQGEWSEDEAEEEEGMLATEDHEKDVEQRAGLPFPQAYRHTRKVAKGPPPLYIFLAIIGVVFVGILIALIAGVIRTNVGDGHPHSSEPQSHPVVLQTKPDMKTSPSSNHDTTTRKPITTSKTTPIVTLTPRPKEVKIQLPPQKSANWRVVLNDTGTESCVRTPDIDGDGLPDVLFGLAHGVDLSVVNTLDEGNSLKKYCEDKNMTYPCVGFLLALRGIDGKELWRIPTRSEIMFMMCDMDLNGDGVTDCVVSGRQSTTQAVDIRKGTTLWYADGSEHPSHFKQMWNVYQAVPLPDVDGDGVGDILVAHGGDPNIDAEMHDRVAGRLIVLSGATGKPLGEYLEMPNSRETYMTPVMYTDSDGSQYILFGSGGETVPGDLIAISLADFLSATDPSIDVRLKGSYRWKEIISPSLQGVMALYSGKEKGVMVPPVIIDIDNDGVKDILVSVFEGSLLLLDGKTLKKKWETSFPNSESYSTPAPGYFDDDEYLDFMTHWSVGAWPSYNSSTVYVVSGKDGSILWEDRRSMYVMSSDLVLRSKEDRFDYFMVKMKGQHNRSATLRTEVHGVGAQRNISKRETPNESSASCAGIKSEYEKYHVTCDQELTNLNEHVYLVNRDNVESNLPLQETLGEKFTYEYTPKMDDEESCVPKDQNGTIHICIPLLPNSRSTDAVTDVDNDGRLDLIYIGTLGGRMRDNRYGYTQMKFTTVISRIDIQAAVKDAMPIYTMQDTGTEKQNIFAPLASQPWLQYLGSETSSVYFKKDHEE